MTNKNIVLENARIVFRNFTGKEGQYNAAGRRNFCVLLDPKLARDLTDVGWNVKYLRPRDEEEEPQAYLQVNVKFGEIPPRVYMITGRGRTLLDESTIDILDWAEIANVDMTVRPYNWNQMGKSGVSGYLKTMYVTLQEDEFEHKYYDVPDSAASAMTERYER